MSRFVILVEKPSGIQIIAWISGLGIRMDMWIALCAKAICATMRNLLSIPRRDRRLFPWRLQRVLRKDFAPSVEHLSAMDTIFVVGVAQSAFDCYNLS